MWRKRKQSDFRAEIDAHLELEVDCLREEGLDPAQARTSAQRAFGNRTAAEERFYESGRWMFLEHRLRDIRLGARVLAKDPRFSILAILGLALGIGVSSAIFTLIHASIQVNEVRDPDSFVGLTRVVQGRAQGAFSYPEYRHYRERAASFREMTAVSGRYRFLVGGISAGEPEEVQGRFVSG